jgi:hypothetical protein
MPRKSKPKADTEQVKRVRLTGGTRSTSTTEMEGQGQTKQELYLSVPGEPVGQPRHQVCTIGGRPRMYLPKSHPVFGFKAAIRRHSLRMLASGERFGVRCTSAFTCGLLCP